MALLIPGVFGGPVGTLAEFHQESESAKIGGVVKITRPWALLTAGMGDAARQPHQERHRRHRQSAKNEKYHHQVFRLRRIEAPMSMPVRHK